MFRLVRFLISLVLLATFVWFGVTVQLGNHTLFGHFARIWRAEPTQDLVKGTKDKATEVIDRAREDGRPDAPARRTRSGQE